MHDFPKGKALHGMKRNMLEKKISVGKGLLERGHFFEKGYLLKRWVFHPLGGK